MNNLIQWPTAKYWTAQWNPIIGCKPCSPACENCYAAAWAKRFRQSFEPHATKQKPPRKGVVFCGNMTDLFGEWVPPNQSADNILAPRQRRHAVTNNHHPTGAAAMTRDHVFVRCEDCRNHGRCKRERTAFKCYHIKGCFVEVKKEDAL